MRTRTTRSVEPETRPGNFIDANHAEAHRSRSTGPGPMATTRCVWIMRRPRAAPRGKTPATARHPCDIFYRLSIADSAQAKPRFPTGRWRTSRPRQKTTTLQSSSNLIRAKPAQADKLDSANDSYHRRSEPRQNLSFRQAGSKCSSRCQLRHRTGRVCRHRRAVWFRQVDLVLCARRIDQCHVWLGDDCRDRLRDSFRMPNAQRCAGRESASSSSASTCYRRFRRSATSKLRT